MADLATRRPPVVHRDVKPANIILRGNQAQAILVDFGVAKPKMGRGPDTAAWGTLGYAAPEQAAGHAEPRSDVYGLAATVYHLLTRDDPGDHPFQFPQLGKLSAQPREILHRALARHVDKRLAAQEMRDAVTTLVTLAASLPLRLLEAHTCREFDRKAERVVVSSWFASRTEMGGPEMTRMHMSGGLPGWLQVSPCSS